MRPPQGSEWLILLFIVVLLFGAKKLPELARGLGRSMRILKDEVRAQDSPPEATRGSTGTTSQPPTHTTPDTTNKARSHTPGSHEHTG